MAAITDIWFYSERRLIDLGIALGLRGVDYDCENYWEWIIGTLAGMQLDITRTHTVPAAATPTRIFQLGRPRFAAIQVELLVTRLKQAGIAPIMAGAWVYRSGDDFDRIIVATWP